MKYYFFNILSILTFSLVIFTSENSNAQSITASPYSRYAFGDLSSNPHSSFYGISGTSLALCDSFQFNSLNPASYSFLLRHRPIFDFGVGGQYLQMKSSAGEASATTFGLRAISLGLPLTSRLGLSFGITPVSSMGYSFVTHETDPVIGALTYKYDGKGGINRLYAGTSFMFINKAILDSNKKEKSHHKLSLGVNIAYLFGSLQNSNRLIVDSRNLSTGILHSKVLKNTFIGDVLFEGGLLYRAKLNSMNMINIGGNFNASTSMYAKREFLAYAFDNVVSESLVDTVEYISSQKGSVYYPKKMGAAISYERRIKHKDNQNAYRRLILSAQYETQDWNQYSEIFDEDTVSDGMKNATNLSFGIQYSPFTSNIIGPDEKWWHISTYRLSFSSASTYLQINNTQLKQYGISFGIGIPLLNSLSFSLLNLGIEAGKRGSLDNGLIEENYINVNLGLTISPHRNDPWFIKRKYD